MEFRQYEEIVSIPASSSGQTLEQVISVQGQIVEYLVSFADTVTDITVKLLVNGRFDRNLNFEDIRVPLYREIGRGETFQVEITNNSATTATKVAVMLLVQEY